MFSRDYIMRHTSLILALRQAFAQAVEKSVYTMDRIKMNKHLHESKGTRLSLKHLDIKWTEVTLSF